MHVCLITIIILAYSSIARLNECKDGIKGMLLVFAPEIMRHFSAKFEPVIFYFFS